MTISTISMIERPSEMLCGSCGHHVEFEPNLKNTAVAVIARCPNEACKDFDKKAQVLFNVRTFQAVINDEDPRLRGS